MMHFPAARLRPFWATVGPAVAVLMAACLLLSTALRAAAAETEPQPPLIRELTMLSPSLFYIRWSSRSGGGPADGLWANLYQNERVVLAVNLGNQPAAGSAEIDDPNGILQPSTRYCVGLLAYVGSGASDGSTFSDESNRFCTTTPAAPSVKVIPHAPIPTEVMPPTSSPDLALEAIRGREEREWADVNETTPTYLIALRNDGADALGTVVVEIATSGALTLAELTSAAREGWATDGFTCTATTPSGRANTGLRCTGGTLRSGQSTSSPIVVNPSRPGFGYIHASIGIRSGPADRDTSDNSQMLAVRIF
jgi:hypothetical protein